MLLARYSIAAFLLSVSLLAFGQTTSATSKFERGSLSKGQPTGTWEYLDDTGQLELRMNYDSSRISYRRPDTARYELRINDTWQLVHPSRAPGLLGSRAGRRQALRTGLRYPVAALQQQWQGDVLLSYVVQPDGSTTDYTVLSSLSPACDQEVWRMLQQLPSRWIPAIYQGQARAARFYLRVHFEMVTARSLDEYKKTQAQVLAPPSGPFSDVVTVTAVGIERR
ncbi:energy transducer TonB [Hymenobacter bucti]|uniref:Energy transducer TonB n=1 Tax=Hymenobacter bucti TaxID=1844114 RepID=A0ABW4QPU5_9BACT